MEEDIIPDIQTIEAAVGQQSRKDLQIFGWTQQELWDMTLKHEIIWLGCLQNCNEQLKTYSSIHHMTRKTPNS